jgi:hypothetical protein
MRWQAHPNDEGVVVHTLRSDSGYAILRCTADGIPTGRFVAFKVHLDRREVLGGYDSSEEAKSACEHHAARRMEAAT